jgi:hypothetical protein
MKVYTAKLNEENALKIRMEDLPEDAWEYITGGSDSNEIRKFWEMIPWLHRGVEMAADAVSGMPWQILSGENVVEESEGYQGEQFPWLGNPFNLLWQLESAMLLVNRAYVFKGVNRTGNMKDFRYMSPFSVRPDIDGSEGLVGFKRNINGQWIDFEIDDFMYFWPPDPFVEVGPSESSPAIAALSASKVLSSLDTFSENHLSRGLIKAMLLTVSKDGLPVSQEERSRVRKWWQNIFQRGAKGGWATDIVNAGKVDPVVIGEGFKDLENVAITNEKREDIATALGIPQSLLFSNATNFATAKQDDKHFYQKRIIPDCNFIEGVLNEQLFSDMNYEFRFMPETLEVFQEEEKDRAQALSFMVSAINADPEVAQVAMAMLGMDMPTEVEKLYQGLILKKEEQREQMADAMENPGKAPNTLRDEKDDDMSKHLALWRKKALRHVGKPKAAQFESDQIPAVLAGAIAGSLEEAQSETDVIEVFSDVWKGY